MRESRQKILVTGAKGMLGRAIAKELNLEYQLVGIDIEDADITDATQIKEEIFEIHPDVVVHCAAYTEVDNCEKNKELTHRVNSKGTENVAQACKLCQAKLIYISTDFVFDGTKKNPYTEEDVPNPINTYGWSKFEGEKYVQDILDNHLIIRTAWLYGPHGRNFVDTILHASKKETELKVVNDQKGCPTYTIDLARAIGILIKADPVGIMNVTNSGSCTWYKLAQKILSIKNIGTTLQPVTSGEIKRLAKRPAYSVLSTEKYEKTTITKIRNWEEALTEYLKSL